MGYTAKALPPRAPNQVDSALRNKAMSRRSSSDADKQRRNALRQAKRAILRFDISCKCKASLIVLCAVGADSGCRERQKEGTCPCRPRWLPSCILETPHGCDTWREGHTCSCPLLYMPRCLVTGCEERRKGRRCECPRTTVEMCRHVRAKIERFAALTTQDASEIALQWAEALARLEPEERTPANRYSEPPLADTGKSYRAGSSAVVALMAERVRGGRSPWHPDDHRGRPSSLMRQRIAGSLNQLLAAIAFSRKGARHG